MENAYIASIFDEIADLLELRKGNRFRVRSYRSAAQTVRNQSQRLASKARNGDDLTKLPNIGDSTADKIAEVVETGTCKRLEDLRKKVPHGLVEMMHIPRVGPSKAMKLHKRLKVKTLKQLQTACEKHRVRKLKGMGAKTEQNILKGIKTTESASGRLQVKPAADEMESVGHHLEKAKAVKHWDIVGSYRRGRETIGDLDFLVRADDRKKAAEEILDYGEIDEVTNRGKERVSVRLKSGLQVDFRFFDKSELGSAAVYFTGSKAHNIALRKIAQEHDWKLNEYGLFSGKRRLAGKTEKSVYSRLGMKWIPPELREDNGEADVAAKGKLPKLIKLDDIRGDLHCHTKASDGKNTVEEMARAAKKRGYDYLAITDHSKAVRVVNGLNESQLRKHAEHIHEAGKKLKGFTLLAGVEVDILQSGKLDLKEDVLSEMDWVIASVHSYFGLSEKEMTRRLLRAIESGVVHCIAHPLGREIGKRDPIKLDLDKIFEACHEHNVLLEINSQPRRLDLPDRFCRAARDAGVHFSINTDAHEASMLDFIRFGVTTARRGWLRKSDVVNTLSTSALRKRLKRR